MERALTAMPSLSSSPRMRSVPQCGFSRAMVAISVRISGFNRGRPSERPDRQRQKRRQPWRCQRRTVSGRTKKEVPSPVPVEAADEKPEELVSGAEARTVSVTESDLELLA